MSRRPLQRSNPWERPSGIYLPREFGRRMEISELSDAVPGPDQRYQTHRAGCQCGEMECPWYRGEYAAKRWAMASQEDKMRWTNDALEPLLAPAPPPT